jgi:hypothetical protein
VRKKKFCLFVLRGTAKGREGEISALAHVSVITGEIFELTGTYLHFTSTDSVQHTKELANFLKFILCSVILTDNFYPCNYQTRNDESLNLFMYRTSVRQYLPLSLHLPSIHLMKYAKGPYVNGIKVFNHLLQTIKNLEHSPVKFKNALKIFFISTPFIQSRNISNKGILQGDHLNKGIF